MASFSRIFAWILNLVGHFLLFSPIIKLLAWIPLVGWLLAAIIKFAAVIFAIIWGSLLHLIVMCVAWIVCLRIYIFKVIIACLIALTAAAELPPVAILSQNIEGFEDGSYKHR